MKPDPDPDTRINTASCCKTAGLIVVGKHIEVVQTSIPAGRDSLQEVARFA